MTNLTKIAITARKTIRYGVYAIIFLMVGKVVLDISIGIYKRIFPTPPPPPTVTFGKLPKLVFPESLIVKINYTLETPDLSLPAFSDQAKVYFMPKPNASLLALDVAKEKARKMGYSSDPTEVSKSIYRFLHTIYPATLETNINTQTFSISYDLNADRSAIDTKPPLPEIANSIAKSLLSSSNSLPADLTGEVTNEFLKLKDGKLVSAVSLSESDLVRVNMFRKSYDNLPSVTTNPRESNVWFIISGSSNKGQQVINAEYHYFPIDEGQFSTYPIKTTAEAFEELKIGKAFIQSTNPINEGDTLAIRRIYLAYYDSGKIQDFYQPIYVFEGDRGFLAYVPAVTAEYSEE